MSASMFTPASSRFFGLAPESVPAAPGHASSQQTFAARVGGATSAVGRQDAGTARAAPRWQSKELRWLAAFLPEQQRDDLVFGLGETLRWRERECGPLPPPKEVVGRVRFGLIGEQLLEVSFDTLRKRLRAELREAIRTLEAEQPRLVRNYLLAMHSIRLGQLYRELLRRGEDALEEARNGLAVLWA